MIMMLTNRNNNFFKSLSVILAIMIVVISIPFSTSASVPPDIQQVISARAAANDYDTESVTRIYIGAYDSISWGELEIRALNEDDYDNYPGTTTNAVDMGTVLTLNKVMRADDEDEPVTMTVSGNIISEVYYVDVPKTMKGIFATSVTQRDQGYDFKSKSTNDLENGAFYYLSEVVDNDNTVNAFTKVDKPNLSSFAINPSSRTNFCLEDEIPFALSRDAVISPINNDFIYKFLYCKVGDSTYTEIKQTEVENAPYWKVKDGKEYLVTTGLDVGSNYDLVMEITDGYVKQRTAPVRIHIDPKGELSIAVATGESSNVYSNNNVWYYGSSAQISVKASEIAKVAYVQDPTDDDMNQINLTDNNWSAHMVTLDENGDGVITVPATTPAAQYTPTKVVVRGYNATDDIIQEKQIELVCDTKAPSIGDANLITNDATDWKQAKQVQYVVEDTEDDMLGSGLVTTNEKFYLENTTTTHTFTASNLSPSGTGRSATAVFEVNESGTYVLHCEDNLGNSSTSDPFVIGYIDAVAPGLTVTERTENTWTNSYDVTFEVNNNVTDGSIADGASAIVGVSYEYLGVDGTETETTNVALSASDRTFNVTKVGVYKITVTDEAGNKAEQTIDLKYIDSEAPSGKLTVNGEEGDKIFKDPSETAVTVSAEDLTDGTAPEGTVDGKKPSEIKEIKYYIDYDPTATLGYGEVTAGLEGDATTEVDGREMPVHGTISAAAISEGKADLFTISQKVNTKFVVYAVITDNAGNSTLVNSSKVIIDSTPPVIDATILKKVDEAYTDDLVTGNTATQTGTWNVGWFNGNAFVKINGITDSGSGLNESTVKFEISGTQYPASKDGDAWALYGRLVSGKYDVKVIAQDNAGNEGTYTIPNVQIDIDSVSVTVNSENLGETANGFEQVNEGTLTVTVTTGVSGVNASSVKVYTVDDDGNETETTLTYTSDPESTRQSEIRHYNIADNGTYLFKAANKAGVEAESTPYLVDNISEYHAGIADKVTEIYYGKAKSDHSGIDIENQNDAVVYDNDWTDKDLVMRFELKNVKFTDTGTSGNGIFKKTYKYAYKLVYRTAETTTGFIDNWRTLETYTVNKSGRYNYLRCYSLDDMTFPGGTVLTDRDGEFYIQFAIHRYRKKVGDPDSSYKYVGPQTPSEEKIDSFKIKIDKTAPTVKKPSVQPNITARIINIITLGFVSIDDVEVTFKATDAHSGVKKFLYSYSKDGEPERKYEVNATSDGTTSGYEATVTIQKDYIGKLTVNAVDNVGNQSSDNKAEYLLIDSNPPAVPSVAAVSNGNPITSGTLTDSDITFNLSQTAESISGIEGFYVSETNNSADAVRIATTDADKDTISASLTYNDVVENITIATCKTATYDSMNYDTNKTIYFFTKSNAGMFSSAVPFTVNIDKTKPQVTKFEFGTDEANTVESNEYGWFFKQATTVKVYATDDFSDNTRPTGCGVATITVWTVDKEGVETQLGDLTPDANGCVSVTISPDFKGNIYAKATDAAGNVSDTKHPYGAIAESPAKHSSENHIAFTKSGADAADGEFSNGDINLTVDVMDSYSGIKNLDWEIKVDGAIKGKGSASVDALSGNITSTNDSSNDTNYNTGDWTCPSDGEKDINLIKKLTRTFKLDYDSNDIVVTVNMTDNAGNTSTKTYTVNIDKTSPVIVVYYDNNDAHNEKYFNADRTITVEIQENNFDDTLASAVVLDITKDGQEYRPATGFTKNDATGYYTWTQRLDDGNYNITKIECTDKAGNPSTTTFDNSVVKAPYIFVIDKTSPVVTITYDNNTHDNGYFKANRTVTVKVDDYAINPADIDIAVTQDGSASSINLSSLAIADAASISTIASSQWQYTFSEDAIYTFNVNSVKDKAGNAATISYGSNAVPTSFTLDKTAPRVNVKYTDNAALQTPNYYKSYRTAEITIFEKNFDATRIDTSAITARDLLGQTSSYTTYLNYLATQLKDENNWTINGDARTQQIRIGQDSDANLINAIFTFGLTVTDKAGNKNTDIDRSSESGNYIGGVLYSPSNSGAASVNTEFVIDGQPPENLKIEITDDIVTKVLNVITGGLFFNKTIKVTLIADDGLSGVASFVYTLDYDQVEGSSVTGSGRNEITINSGIEYDGNTAKASFNIEPQYRGKISFKAIDRAAAESTTYKPSNVIVVDNVAPKIEVSYNNNNKYESAADGLTYYGDFRTLTVKVRETNFYPEDIKMSIDRVDDSSKSIESVTLGFSADNSGSTPVYTATYPFNEDGHYKVKITYNDRSGNAAGIIKTVGGITETDFGTTYLEEYVIDTTEPRVTVTAVNSDGTTCDGEYEEYVKAHTVTVTVTETNFVNKDDFAINITAKDLIGNDITAPTQSGWSNTGVNVYTKTINFNDDGIYTFNMNYTDPAGHSANIKYGDGTAFEGEEFIIDREAPDNIQISYNDSAWRKIVNVLTAGLFFGDTVTVKVRLDEKVSGVDKIEYICDVADGVSSVNRATSGVITGSDITKLDYSTDDSLKYTYEVSFNVNPQYRGKVKLKITDKAGNTTNASDSADANELIVDSLSPTWGRVSYNYQGNYKKSDNVSRLYFNRQITGALSITEANFDKNKKLNVSITRNGSTYDASKLEITWDESPDANDKWNATFKLNTTENGEYIIKLNYTDVAGNAVETFTSTPLVIDTVNPKFEVAYDNNDAKNGIYFPRMRTATLKITEENIKTDDISITITEENASGNKSVKKPNLEWKTVGNTHTATFQFNSQMHYVVDIKCKDLATNEIDIQSVEFGESTAPTEFYVDRVKPTGTITVGNWSASVNGTVWDKILSTITFGLYTRNDVAVTITSADDLSGVNNVGYIISAVPLTESQLRSRTDWTTVKSGTDSFNLGQNKQFIVYTKITDRAENVQYISSDGIIIDQTNPRIDGVEPIAEISLNAASDTPEYDTNGNMLFNGNVALDVKVTDDFTNVDGVEVYSGLNSVTYQVISNGVETQSGSLNGAVDKVVNPTTGLTYSQTDTVTISADRNNTNDIQLIVTAVDNVGNRTVETQKFIIDTTPPQIAVSYDNNSPDTMGAFYKDARTATVTITERNFNASKVAKSITHVGGTEPNFSEWTTIEGATPDDTRHVATLVYSADGDYKFDITYTDEAGNKAGVVDYGASVNPTEFTIDRTLPTISIVYDNNNAQNGKYYSSARTATISISEHNFEASRVVIKGTANDDGTIKAFPKETSWTASGADVHSASITFTDDAEYIFTVDYVDKAGNAARTSSQQDFFIDNINPTITVSDVEDEHAYGYGSTVAPTITFYDKNFDTSKVRVTLIGAKRGNVDFKASNVQINNGVQVIFDDIESIRNNDDIYTLSATVTDLSGRSYTLKPIKFSVNRFGSTYEIEDNTKRLVETYYVQSVDEDVIVIETNVDAITNYEILLSINGNQAEALVEDRDFTVKTETDGDKWTKYTYIIDKSLFAHDATYDIVLKSTDGADNNAYSDLTDANLKFVVDNVDPTVAISGITDNGRYRVESQTVRVLVSDDNLLSELTIIVNGGEPQTWTDEELADMDYTVVFALDSSNDEQQVQIICTDAAGNVVDRTIGGIIVSTSTFVQVWNNAYIFYGAIGVLGFVILTSLIIILVKRRKKDDEEDTIDIG